MPVKYVYSYIWKQWVNKGAQNETLKVLYTTKPPGFDGKSLMQILGPNIEGIFQSKDVAETINFICALLATSVLLILMLLCCCVKTCCCRSKPKVDEKDKKEKKD